MFKFFGYADNIVDKLIRSIGEEAPDESTIQVMERKVNNHLKNSKTDWMNQKEIFKRNSLHLLNLSRDDFLANETKELKLVNDSTYFSTC